MPFIRYCKVIFWGYFGHIPEQTHLQSSPKKIQTIGHTIPRKLQICYAGYFGHVQAHSLKTGKFF